MAFLLIAKYATLLLRYDMRSILRNFIVIEGLDGAGTTTQKKAIEAELNAEGIRTYATHEPTDNPIGRTIRAALQHEFRTTPEALAYLYASDRHDHLYNEDYGLIKHIEEGETVISDRYIFSSIAYQSVECSPDLVRMLNTAFPYPGIVIFIDTPVSSCISRIESRGEDKELFDRSEFLEKVRLNYISEFSALPPGVRYLRIDGTLSIQDIKGLILDFIRASL
mgnify:CR=1 FL=1